MSLFDKFKKNVPANAGEGLPNMQPENLTDFRVREKEHAQKLAAETKQRENEGLPSVNRRKGGSKLVTTLGFVFIAGVAMALIFAVNGDKEPVQRSKPNETQVANTLPPLVIPAAPPPITLTATPAPANTIQAPAIGTTRTIAPTTPSQNPDNTLHWLERKMRGTLLIKTQGSANNQVQPTMQPAGNPANNNINRPSVFAGQPGATPSSNNELAARLQATETRGVSASLLPNRNFLITKGTTLDCALETALDSTVPGITTCRLTRDIYSDNGKVLLLDRGSQLVGEYQGGLRQGQVRLFVLWTRAKTPHGVVISLNSPGTDALGRSGLEGWVDNHFLERFGAAILMSFIRDSVTAIVNNTGSRSGGTTNVYGNTAESGEKVVEKILESTVNIPPTIIKNQGDHIQVMVARDLDFSSVYELQAKQ